MFNSEFYPTKVSTIENMLSPYIEVYGSEKIKYFKGKYIILDPSAGKGDILDYITKNLRYQKNNIYAIEIDTELQHILHGKKYKVIATDFLEYFGDYNFNLIVMNPPFSNGVDHLLHAWDILQSGDIVCLLNAETIRNPYSQKRKTLLNIIEKHGTVEYLENEFHDAERKTDVDIALIRLKKVNSNKSKFDFDFNLLDSDENVNFDESIVNSGEIAINNVIDNMLRQYENTKLAFINYMKAKEQLKFYSNGLMNSNSDILQLSDTAISNNPKDKELQYNEFQDQFKLSAWRNILRKLNIEKYLTNSVLKNFSDFTNKQGALSLTSKNIYELIMLITNNRDNIMKQAIIDVFNLFTKYHKENREIVEGWKTNESWVVKQKVILPGYIKVGYNTTFSINYYHSDEFRDIEKVMCYLSGTNYDDLMNRDNTEYITLVTAIENVTIGDRSVNSSHFFDFRCYKKGTIHLHFKDETLLNKFNLIACDGLWGLPVPNKKNYKTK